MTVQSQNLKIKTFEETMVQLDDVFTNSASGENEVANLDVVVQLKVELEAELNKGLKNLQGLP